MTEPDVHTLTGPYVLDALPEDERIHFEAHLAECTFCSTEVDELRAASIKLTTQVAGPPPHSLKGDVMGAIDQVRQRPPVVGSRGVGKYQRGFTRRSMLALAAAALAVATAGGVAIDQHRDKTDAIQANDRVTAVLSQPDARTTRGTITGGGVASMVTSRHGDSAVVVLRELRKLPDDKTWQLWLIDSNQTAHSIGLASGDLTQVVVGGLADKIAFGLTIEPKGGSPKPTLPTAAVVSMA